jgi:hypothetical protein
VIGLEIIKKEQYKALKKPFYSLNKQSATFRCFFNSKMSIKFNILLRLWAVKMNPTSAEARLMVFFVMLNKTQLPLDNLRRGALK